MTTNTTMDPPVDLPLPLEWPTPSPRCGVCGALARQRTEAAAAGDYSKVSDCNIEIRAHLSPHRRRQP
ncbi:hypothetical protein ABZU94_07215 [Streptomyces mirabilis]|uniref:hypothetical protein n=1 Tax=Streptomyces sp. NPDC005388 TaxID=3156717 RepID=UPI00339F00D5